YKGGFPSRYGGRASSVIDIYTKDGNNQELKGKFNIGLLNSGFMIESPLTEKISCFFAARSSYYDLYTISARREYNQTGTGEYFGYTFYDINGKINWSVSQKNKITLSVFSGHDYQKSVEAVNYSAQKKDAVDKLSIHNTGVSVSQNSVLNHKVFLKNMIAFSSYNNSMSSRAKFIEYGSTRTESLSSFSEINDVTFQSRLEIYPNNTHSIKTGVEISRYNFVPGLQSSNFENENAQSEVDTTIGFKTNLSAFENSFYFEDELSFSNNIKINLGIRGTNYICKDTAFYRIEPRLSFRVLISEEFSFKANYTLMNHYNHVLVNNEGGFEKEIWLATTKGLLPQRAQQTSVGFFYSNVLKQLDVSLEGFYKKMSNLLEYRSPTDEADNFDNIENIVAKNGRGKSYGLEFQIKKEYQNLSANINYTLAWNYRKFNELNNGKWFPFVYDRRHDLSVVAMWKMSDKYSFSSNFSLSSGMPCTLPIGYSATDDYFYHYYIFDEINNRQLPLYHRLDVVLVRKGKTKKGNTKQFSLNIFNLYARENPVYIYYDSRTGKVYQKSLFSIVPTISYSVQF
ncbi:MAG: TonB-dependent receptor, partial [Bacteroidota bacterium]|nr:TonB-dependent receptor [Bacteroidota bacterium]